MFSSISNAGSAPGPLEPVRYLDMWIRYALMRKVRVLRVKVHIKRDAVLRFFFVPQLFEYK